MDPLTCPYCGIAPEEDPDDLLEGADELILTQPAFSRCGDCGRVAVAMPPDARLRPATDFEFAAFGRADQQFRDQISGVRRARIRQHFARKLGTPSDAQQLGRRAP